MLELRILSGLHRGAALPLDGDAIHIGSGDENDISLLDPGMPERAGVLVRSGQTAWLYYAGVSYEAGQCDAARVTLPAHGAAVGAGSRWFAGPVLVGCDREGSPWPVEPAPQNAPASGARRLSTRMKVGLAIVIATIVCCSIVAALGARITPAAIALPTAAPSAANDAISAPSTAAPVRVVKGTIYPSDAFAPPPFGIRSARGGPYSFLVTDDDHTLMPGSRWKAYTLERIEAGRAVFSGPRAAELHW